MLVDLARNDLSRNGHTVNVDTGSTVFPMYSFGLWVTDIYMKKPAPCGVVADTSSSRNIKWSAKT
jgi:hypothetical protein